MSESSQNGGGGDSGMRHRTEVLWRSVSLPKLSAQDRPTYAAELERVRAEQQRYLAQSDARKRVWARSRALSARLEQALREAEEAKQDAERAWSLVAGLRRAFYLRRMPRWRRFIRRLLPKALHIWWDERNLSRLEKIVQTSGLFDTAWYQTTYPESARSGLSPIRDYLQFGAAEGRWPRRDFDPDQYFAERPILAFLGLNPFVHFVIEHSNGRTVGQRHGEEHGQAQTGEMDGSWTDELHFGANEAEGCFNDGWYGARRLSGEQRFVRCEAAERGRIASDERLKIATGRIVRTFRVPQTPHAVDVLRKAAPIRAIREAFLRAEPDATLRFSETLPCYAIVTSCTSFDDSFMACAESIKALMEVDFEAVGFNRIIWIIVAAAELPLHAALDVMFEKLPAVFLQSEAPDTDAAGARYAASETEAEWIVRINPTEEIELSALTALDYYGANFPRCRCILASPVDVDEDGIILRRNRNPVPSALFEHDLHRGQFIAVRRDLIVHERNPFDYETLLNLSLHEPILAVPEYLHRHRWSAVHGPAAPGAGSRSAEWALRGFLRRFAERLPGPGGHPPRLSASPSSGLCIIRTQGTRIELLAETVASVLAQPVAIRPCVVVHGPSEVEREVRDRLATQHGDIIILAAPDVERRRGYPLNVGLDFLVSHDDEYDFVFFLDDDDIIYPFYGDRMVSLIGNTNCDIGVCISNSRVPWLEPQPGHQLLPISTLVAGNFIPIHCYVVRTEFIVRSAAKFDESVDYLEDWDFLVKLLMANASFSVLPEVLCEYRIIGDGNQQRKRNQAHFEHCEKMVLEQGRLAAKRLGLKRFVNDLADFDFNQRAALSPAEIDRLIEVRTIFEAQMNEPGR